MAEEYFGLTCQSLCDALSTLKGAYEATNTDFNLYWSVGEWGKGVHSISESVHVVLSDTISMLKHQQAEIERLKAQQAEITQSEAEMMIEHKDGTVEYVKDIDNIMLLADKDYQIAYTGTF